jgi:inner membrane protein
MRWASHMMIGGSVCAVWEPALVPWAVLGSTAPDWLEWVGRQHRPLHRVTHRGTTHTLLGWLLCAVTGLVLEGWGRPLLAFALAGTLHWLCDALTVTGAPVTWWSQHRSTLFGGRLRQGSPTERAIAVGVVAVCALVVGLGDGGSGSSYTPYVMPWRAHYQSGLIDAAEWRRHRFHPF